MENASGGFDAETRRRRGTEFTAESQRSPRYAEKANGVGCEDGRECLRMGWFEETENAGIHRGVAEIAEVRGEGKMRWGFEDRGNDCGLGWFEETENGGIHRRDAEIAEVRGE